MGLFYKASPKELFQARIEIFVKKGLPELERNGFRPSPYAGMRFGKYDAWLYAYDLCRLSTNSNLETITVYISRKDRWIKIYLNIFELTPPLNAMEKLNGIDGMQFHLPPNSITKMRLRMDDFAGMPLFRTIDHKIKSFYTLKGFQKCIFKLSELITSDLTNIDHFVQRWCELHQPMKTTWDGKKVEYRDKKH